MDYAQTARSTPSRYPERVRYDAEAVHAVLDEALVCHLGFTAGSEPRVLPTLHVRVGQTLYLHGSTGSGPLLAAASPTGLAVCVTVTLIDGLVFARSAFHHSVRYRSVVALGRAHLVSGAAQKRTVLDALLNHLADGRAADCRPPSPKELAATAVLALPLDEVSVKVRTGGVADEPEDLDLPYWAGLLPVSTAFGALVADQGCEALTVPGYLRDHQRAG